LRGEERRWTYWLSVPVRVARKRGEEKEEEKGCGDEEVKKSVGIVEERSETATTVVELY
jgi:hypothetical protein